MADEIPCYDVLIVGGGPAGLSAALVLARALRRVLVIDAGQPRNRPARHMHGYLTRDGLPPLELLEMGRREVGGYGVEVLHDAVVAAKAHSADCPTSFTVTTGTGSSFLARKLLFATGMCDRLPTWPGFSDCYGISVHHCPYCDGYEHRGQRLAATGENPNKAVGLALLLLQWTPRVIVLTDGEPLQIDKELQQRVAQQRLQCHPESIRRLHHRDGSLHQIELAGGKRVDVEGLFFNTDHTATCQLPRQLGCQPRAEEASPTDNKQHTSVPGVFLAGDADGDVQFVIVAAAEGATAAVTINRELCEEDLAAQARSSGGPAQ